MKTKLEIVQETIEYYGSDPSRRGVNPADGNCQYLTEAGKMCAFGLRMKSPDMTYSGSITCLLKEGERVEDIEEILQDEYKGHEIGFWYMLQDWHDTNANFDETGLSKIGEITSRALIERYSS